MELKSNGYRIFAQVRVGSQIGIGEGERKLDVGSRHFQLPGSPHRLRLRLCNMRRYCSSIPFPGGRRFLAPGGVVAQPHIIEPDIALTGQFLPAFVEDVAKVMEVFGLTFFMLRPRTALKSCQGAGIGAGSSIP